MKTPGFSLMELIIALVIVAIMASLAYPSYQSAVYRSRRSEAKTALLDLASHMEEYHLAQNTYAGATFSSLGVPSQSEHGFYDLQIVRSDEDTYLLFAKPTFADPAGKMQLDELGVLS